MIRVLLLVVCASKPVCAGVVLTTDDIRYWVGTGTNEAVLVVDWAETPDKGSLAWGFRWNGVATGEDMFRAIAEEDHRFFAKLGTGGPFGVPLYGIGYDRDDDGFQLSDSTNFVDGVALSGPSDSATAVDPRDSYNEGWDLGFWSYYIGDGQPFAGGSWAVAGTGFGSRILSSGAWDGFSFAPGFEGSEPVEPTAAVNQPRTDLARTGETPNLAVTLPEPASALMCWLALAMFFCQSRRVRGSSRPRARHPIAVLTIVLLTSIVSDTAAASNFASQVVSYDQGTGTSPDFANPENALGAPTRITSPDSPFGGPVTPFQSPFGSEELVTVGFGGQLTLRFDRPVRDEPTNPFGVDLIVFGNSFYFDADFPHGIVGGLGAEPGLIELSQDGVSWRSVTAAADTAFPTLGYLDVLEPFPTGGGTLPSNFRQAVDPELDVSGLSMPQLIAAYDGAGGGTGVDIQETGWQWAQFVRISNHHDPASGITPEIDAVVIVPEPVAGVWLAVWLLIQSRRGRR